jgi:hypothetical protein
MIRQHRVVFTLACVVSAWTFASLGCGGGGGNGGPNCTSKNPLNVAGTYNLSVTGLDSSTCPSDLTSAIENNVSAIAGTETVTQNGSVVNLEPGLVGCVDDQGNVVASEPLSESDQGCTVSANVTVTMNLGSTPSHGQETMPLRISSGCNLGITSCTVVVGFSVTQIGSAQLAPSTGGDTMGLSATAEKAFEAVVNAH